MKKLGFGFMRLPLLDADDPTNVDVSQVTQMVDLFLERGFTYFDTAYMYHGFASEKIIRQVLTSRYPRDRFILTTKMPTMRLKEKEDLNRIFDEQLEKCGVDYFDYYLLHNLNTTHYEIAQRLNAFDFIRQKKQAGQVRKIGFSYHDGPQLLEQILTEHPYVDVVQLQINYLDWDSAGIQSRKCYEVACRHGKEVIVMEPVKGGALANVPEEVRQLFLQAEPKRSVASWAIRFAASLDGVIMVLSGMSNLEQLTDNVGYMEDFQPLDEKERDIVARAVKILEKSIAIPCTGCNYCTGGCPAGIPIPTYFSLYNAEMQSTRKGFSLSRAYYENYAKNHSKASACIECGQCEGQCPQHLPVIQWLKKVVDVLEE
ncbi:MAG: aldo/keto reductase [Clostridiales bacterium]|nr:aldo/keto reductase [Clostridiales bacterium]